MEEELGRTAEQKFAQIQRNMTMRDYFREDYMVD